MTTGSDRYARRQEGRRVALWSTAALALTVVACVDTPSPSQPEDTSPVMDRATTTAAAPGSTLILAPLDVTIDVGGTLQFSASGFNPQGKAVNRRVKWSSADETIVSVNSTGFATAIAPGTTTLVANSGGLSATAQITVPFDIVFSAPYDGNPEIYRMKADGSGLTRLTNDPAADVTAAQSRTGSVAFVSTRGRPSGELYTMDGNGGALQRLTDSPNPKRWPTWSPDGTQIAFVQDDRVHVIAADGTGLAMLTTTPRWEDDPTWSGAGAHIAFAVRAASYGPLREIVTHDLLTGLEQNVTNTPSADEGSPEWSPDGTQIAFVSTRGGSWDVYVMNADGTNVRSVVTWGSTELHPAWSTDGTRLAFMSNSYGDWEVFVVDLDGGNLERLTSRAGREEGISWAR